MHDGRYQIYYLPALLQDFPTDLDRNSIPWNNAKQNNLLTTIYILHELKHMAF